MDLTFPGIGLSGAWTDRAIQGGWHLQCHSDGRRWRVIDADGHRRAVGNETDCAQCFATQAPAWPAGTRLVMMLHGLGPTRVTFRRLAKALAADGWTPCILRYSSSRHSLPRLVADLAMLLTALPEGQDVSFVTHSMGGVVLRGALSTEQHRHLRLGKAVMLAPPNQGSQMADLLGDLTAAQAVFGPALQDLRPGRPTKWPALPLPCLVVAGTAWLNPLLTGPDDGTVTVAETLLAGAQHAVVAAQHTRIADHPESIRLTRRFLASVDEGPPGAPARVSPHAGLC